MDRDEKWVYKLLYVEFTINSLAANYTGKMPLKLNYKSGTWDIINYLYGMHCVE